MSGVEVATPRADVAPPADGPGATSPSGSYRRSVSWSVVAVGGQQGLTALLSFVLALLVGPEAFGTIAIAMVYVVFVQLLVRQGMIQTLVQRRDLDDTHVDSAFWMVVAGSLVLSGLSIAASGPLASLNDLPALRAVIIWLSPLVLLQGLSVVQEALLRRRMAFRSLALRTLTSVGVGGVVGIGLASAGAGVWALVGQQLTMATAAIVVLWHASGWRPRLRFSALHARELLGFSAGSALGSLGNFASSRADALLIGVLLGPIAVGLYRLAARLTEIVTDVFTRSIQQVALPELSRLQGDAERFRARTLDVVRLTSVVTIPLLGVLAAGSTPLFELLGDDWAPATTALQVLCAVTAVRSVMLVNAAVVLAAGRPFLNAAHAWCAGVASVTAFLSAGLMVRDAPIAEQVLAVALARLAAQALVALPTQLYLLRRVVGLPLGDLSRQVLPAALAGAAAMAAGTALLEQGWIGSLPALARFAWTVGAALVAGALVLVASERRTIAAALAPLRMRIASDAARVRP